MILDIFWRCSIPSAQGFTYSEFSAAAHLRCNIQVKVRNNLLSGPESEHGNYPRPLGIQFQNFVHCTNSLLWSSSAWNLLVMFLWELLEITFQYDQAFIKAGVESHFSSVGVSPAATGISLKSTCPLCRIERCTTRNRIQSHVTSIPAPKRRIITIFSTSDADSHHHLYCQWYVADLDPSLPNYTVWHYQILLKKSPESTNSRASCLGRSSIWCQLIVRNIISSLI